MAQICRKRGYRHTERRVRNAICYIPDSTHLLVSKSYEAIPSCIQKLVHFYI